MKPLEKYLGWQVDYATPFGEPAFATPDSVTWRVFKNPVALAIGGVCAVLLEFADDRIRSGVWDHSVFKTDPIGRSQRTGVAAMVGVYGPQSAARRVIQGVTNMHSRVEGRTPNGRTYKALDVDLLDWVSATAGYGFMTAYHNFVSPLSNAEQTQFFQEGEAVARLYGVENPVLSIVDFEEMMAKLLPDFEPHPISTEFLDIMKSGRAAPDVPKGLQSAMVHAAVDILPAVVRDRLELGKAYNLSWKGRMTVRALAKIAERIPDLDSPAAQASERLGLPRKFPWMTKAAQTRLLDSSVEKFEYRKA